MIYGATQIQFSTSNSNWIPDDDDVSNSFREVVYNFGGNTESLTIILISNQGDLRDIQTIRDTNKLITQLQAIPNVDTVTSPFNGLEYDSNTIFNELTYNDNLKNTIQP